MPVLLVLLALTPRLGLIKAACLARQCAWGLFSVEPERLAVVRRVAGVKLWRVLSCFPAFCVRFSLLTLLLMPRSHALFFVVGADKGLAELDIPLHCWVCSEHGALPYHRRSDTVLHREAL